MRDSFTLLGLGGLGENGRGLGEGMGTTER